MYGYEIIISIMESICLRWLPSASYHDSDSGCYSHKITLN